MCVDEGFCFGLDYPALYADEPFQNSRAGSG